MKITMITGKGCSQCIALKAILKAKLTKDNFNKIEMIDVEDFGVEKLKSMGSSSLPTVILDDSKVYPFSNLMNMVALVTENLG